MTWLRERGAGRISLSPKVGRSAGRPAIFGSSDLRWMKCVASVPVSCMKTSPMPSLQCEAPKIAKLVNITPITMVYGTYNYRYWGL